MGEFLKEFANVVVTVASLAGSLINIVALHLQKTLHGLFDAGVAARHNAPSDDCVHFGKYVLLDRTRMEGAIYLTMS